VSLATLEQAIADNLASVRARIARAARSSGRSASDVRLIAVTKTFGIEHIQAVVAAGQVDLGENRVQEALDKIARTPDLPVRWHLIGHLQSNKVRKAVGPFVCIHSVDSVELLRRIDAVAVEVGARPDTLVQVDLAGEATKHGADEAEVRRILEAARACRAARVIGLMLLPPLFENPEDVRPYFVRLRELRDRLAEEGVDRACLRELSMGMSHDFEVAVEEQSTMVRVGSAIFGVRHV
jgi:pyridoxal phosphate enzyme (YggS family)